MNIIHHLKQLFHTEGVAMKTSYSQKKRALYGKLLAALSLCVSFTLLVSTIGYYFYYTGVEKERAFRSDLSSLNQASREVINLNNISQSLSFQLYRSSVIAKILYYDKPNIYDVTGAMLELRNYLNSIPFIDSIYVYNSHNGLFYVASNNGRDGIFERGQLADKGILDNLNNYKDVKPFVPVPRVLDSGGAKHSSTPVYTFLAFDAINREQIIDSAVIVNISAAWSHKDFTSASEGSLSFILDDKGRFLSGTELTEEPLEEHERVSILSRIKEKSENYFIESFGDSQSLISFTSPDSLGWQYVRISPYNIITEKTESIRNMTLLIAIIILSVGLIVSRILSKRLYRPIEKIVDEMNMLENEKRENMFTLRQNALRDLIHGAKPPLQQLGIFFNLEKGYRLVLFRIDRFQELRAEHGFSIASYKFAIMNIVSEVCSQAYLVEGVDMNDDSVLFLFNTDAEADPDDDKEIVDLLRQCRDACLEYIKIGVSGTYSPVDKDPKKLPHVYAEVREASSYRFFLGYGSLINSAVVTQFKRGEFFYPSEKEKKMVDVLVNGKACKATEHWLEIINDTKTQHFQASQLALSNLSVALKSVVDNMKKRKLLPVDGLIDIPDYTEYETLEELQTAFSQWFEEISEQLADKKNNKQSELVRRIQAKIEATFADPNLNVSMIADELGMSPVYISRLYRQQTTSTIMDFIMQTRMNEVCRLLEATELSVADIAENTGFTSTSYLHRIFKRQFNVTPIEYRRSLKP